MYASIPLIQWVSYAFVYPSPLLNFLSSEQTNRIKSVAIAIFSKLAAFFRTFNHQPNEINIKTIAMISCLSLIALLVISRFNVETRVVLPPTPRKE